MAWRVDPKTFDRVFERWADGKSQAARWELLFTNPSHTLNAPRHSHQPVHASVSYFVIHFGRGSCCFGSTR